jgi:hypothetical protein
VACGDGEVVAGPGTQAAGSCTGDAGVVKAGGADVGAVVATGTFDPQPPQKIAVLFKAEPQLPQNFAIVYLLLAVHTLPIPG